MCDYYVAKLNYQIALLRISAIIYPLYVTGEKAIQTEFLGSVVRMEKQIEKFSRSSVGGALHYLYCLYIYSGGIYILDTVLFSRHGNIKGIA